MYNIKIAAIIGLLALMIICPQYQFADETLCYTERVTDAPSFNIYTGKDDANNPIVWTHNVPVGILDSVVRVGLYIEAWDVDYPPDGDEYDRVMFNGYDLGYLEGSNDSWFTVEKTVPVAALREGVNNLEVQVDTLGKTWKVTIRASELRFYCSSGAPDFSIGATPASQTVYQGGSTQYTVNLTGLNGFSSPVTLSVAGLPSGAAETFVVNPLTPSPTGETTLTIDTTSEVTVGSHTLTITGTSGEIVRTAEVTLIVEEGEAPPEGGDFSMTATPTKRSGYPGESHNFKITLAALEGFDQAVQLSADTLPPGATVKFQPESVTPDGESYVTITTTETTPAGTYTIPVTGEGGGKTHEVELTVEVQERPPDPDFEILIDPSMQSLKVGQSVSSTVTLKSLNDFADTVNLTIDGVPEGTTVNLGQTAITPDGSTQLTVTTSETTPLGKHELTVTAVGGGLEHSATFTFEVQCRDFNVQARASVVSGSAPLTVELDALVNVVSGTSRRRVQSDTDTQYKYKWNFGDGDTSDQQEVEHVYQNPGHYNAVVTVTDTCGNSKKASVAIDVDSFEGALVATFSPTTAQPGDTVTLQLEARNQTRVDFENIQISTTLSPYLQYIEDSSGVTVSRSGQELKWQFPLLTKKQTVAFTVTLKVSEDAPGGVITDTAYLSHHSLGAGNSIASNTTSLTIQQLQVSLLKQVEETTVKPGGTVKYQLTLFNKSDATLSQFKLTDTLDSRLEYLSQSSSTGVEFSKNGRTMEWRGDLGPQAQAVIILKAVVSDSVFAGTRIENTATVESAKLKEDIQSNTVAVAIESEPVASGSVRFTKRAEVPQSEVGRIIRFNLSVTNSSNGTLVSPVIEDYLPQGFSYVASSTLLNNQNFTDPQGTRRLMWQLPHIKPGETYTLRYQIVIGADVSRGRNENRAVLISTDTSGQSIRLEDSAFVNVSVTSFTFYSGVEGTVYLDRDYDEFYSMTDTPLEGIEVRLSNGQKAVTDRMGQYRFENLFSGEYAIGINTATLPDKYKRSDPYSKVAVLSDGLTDTVDFGIRFQGEDVEKTARLEGRVFYDKNRNLTYESSDTLAQQFKAYLDDTKVTSGSNGKFVFSHLPPGSHTIEIRCGPKTIKKEIILKDGNNILNIPLPFTGIKIIVTGEGK